jgi:hypothetical protein
MDQGRTVAVIGVFPNAAAAKLAIDDLYYAGFRQDQVGVVSRDETLKEAETSTTAVEKSATTGAVAGTVTGAALGAAAGLMAAVLIPGFGTIITGGVLTGILGAAALGAAGGNLIGPFIAMGLSEEKAEEYDREFRAGRTVLMVSPEGRDQEAVDILNGRGALRVSVLEGVTIRPRPEGAAATA